MTDLLSHRRARVAAALSPGDTLLVVASGEPVPLPENSDQCYPFVAHSEFAYLADNEEPGAVVVFDARAPQGEQWVDFVPQVSEGERVWEGKTQVPGRPVGELDAWMRARVGRPIALLGAGLSTVRGDAEAGRRARELLTHARRPKDSGEIARMRRAAEATRAGFEAAARLVRPGVSERELQIALETGFLQAGADKPGFGTIVGSGPNAAVLHFSPSSRRVQEGEFVLIDAGAQAGRYTADVTRTFAAGPLSAFQRDLYQVVLGAQRNAVSRCRPGAEWKEVHLACAVEMMEGLKHMGVVRGQAESLVEQEAHTLFFPHGLGHLVGLGVRDASGLQPGRAKDPRPCLRTLRMDLPLGEGYIVTVEPGLYFIPPLLEDPVRRARYRDHVDWELVARHLHIGGVRIEDDVLVTAAGPEVLTAAIPK